ncbi:hypothetical protein GLYMA_15G036000v4 [Glycine max]|uniref:Uncharacterized protein n=1 Tax=Glycine max TaxID=3847 RepID=A0A0R0G6Q3_SOYBN|nr:probable protein phosphatase 2C 11 isoform X1 [Glycine max]KAG4955577.1 hypothetical protein JHK85_041957 [Glycine max]KAG5115445.1 hypothetical protein JHK84_041558 [Glycine max]KRH10228.1 hypothetical protein GLYMA_15G036000v4 [Glycine max]|eukprot:XP_014623866.1 probable protein phosphatase 2C 11 isoform X1 [Glycine max]
MLDALKQREQQFGGLRAFVMKEKEEELALFLVMKKREKEHNDLLLNSSEEFYAPLGKAISKFCCKYPYLQLLKSETYLAGDLGTSL